MLLIIFYSSTYITFCATFPVKPKSNGIINDGEVACSQESVGSNIGADSQNMSNQCADIRNETQGPKFEQAISDTFPSQNIEGSLHNQNLTSTDNHCNSESSTSFREILDLEETDFLRQFCSAEKDRLSSNANMDLESNRKESGNQKSGSIDQTSGNHEPFSNITTAPFELNVDLFDRLGFSSERDMEGVESKDEINGPLKLSVHETTTQQKATPGVQEQITVDPVSLQSKVTTEQNINHLGRKKSTPRKKTSKVETKQETTIDWDELRRTYCSKEREKDDNAMDSVDWEAVRNATVEEIAQTIAQRGMNNVLAARIKVHYFV